MPEGPEVALVVHGLQDIVGRKLRGIIVQEHKKYSEQGMEHFSSLIGNTISSISRHGKYISWTIGDAGVLNHAGMTGVWHVIDLAKYGLEIEWEEKSPCFFNFRDFSSSISLSTPPYTSLLKILSGYLQQNKIIDLRHEEIDILHSQLRDHYKFQRNSFKKRPMKSKQKGNLSNSNQFIQVPDSLLPSLKKCVDEITLLSGSRSKQKDNLLQSLVFRQLSYMLCQSHIKIVLFIEPRFIAYFSDPRIFGQFTVYPSSDKLSLFLKNLNLGPDILQTPFDHDGFSSRLSKHQRSRVGSILLRSDVIAGCGNIYRAEALFSAKISPFRYVNSLSSADICNLGKALSEIATLAYSLGGSTIQDYQNPLGTPGSMQSEFRVYGNDNFPCTKCGELVKKDKLTGRSIFWCSACQI